MRNGQGVKFNIRKMLESGTRLEVLETDQQVIQKSERQMALKAGC
ncbi:hypothetical protein [Shewanella glacialipiscicola]|nr:hypothetical protein [Shewanella glacialipiscicola]